VYGLAVLGFYNIRMNDIYQDHIVGLGTLSGISAAAATSLWEWDLEAFKDYVPVSITAALALSWGIHGALYSLKPMEERRED
jgi:hypothetical protein